MKYTIIHCEDIYPSAIIVNQYDSLKEIFFQGWWANKRSDLKSVLGKEARGVWKIKYKL